MSQGVPAYLVPEWNAPAGVRAAFTLRSGGVSAAPFNSLNLGAHVGDDPVAVSANRRQVMTDLSLPSEPAWLEQVHGIEVADADTLGAAGALCADAVIARRAGTVAVIQVADCMPVLLAARDGRAVAAAHAGWRGLAAGVLEATVRSLGVPPAHLLAWLGPAIGPRHFEVGDEVREAFVVGDSTAAVNLTRNSRGRWQCDLAALARQRLRALGVPEICGGHWCTYADPERFFSYRRDGRCGRMAALIWRI